MSTSTALRPSEVPAVLSKAFPEYRGRTFRAEIATSFGVQNTHWDGGTCHIYRAVHLASGRSAPLASPRTRKPGDPFGWFEDACGKSFDIQPGFVVVEHTIFCGKDLGLRFYVHPDDATKMLPAPEDKGLSERDREILAVFRSLKSFARPEYLQAVGFTQEDRARLADMGMLKVSRNGATRITIDGRNACQGVRKVGSRRIY